MNKAQYLLSKKGEAVFVTCARWGYRGIIEDAGENGLLLSSPFMIFDSSSYTDETVKEEFVIPSDLFLSLDAIESICQPIWCFKGYERKRKK